MKTVARRRPLSPHLQVYRPTITMTMSILHRATGVALYVGALLLAWWLFAVAMGPDSFSAFQTFSGSWIGRGVWLGYAWALIHHLLGGLRHFIWDAGQALAPRTASALAWATLIGSILLTVVVWLAAEWLSGAHLT
jgi:succinate dehydrogenase / fumarate reductase cytochrome b subunit